ncbi:MAG TPA: hypothetical protein VGR19_02070 [Allosphingosinicella sp.]|nr:hypothetical protein [Allosphingosinicella sp.]
MTNKAFHAAAAAIFMLSAQPCVAAQGLRDFGAGQLDAGERRTAGFAGMNVRVPLGHRAGAKPAARLQLGVTHSYRNPHFATPAQSVRLASFELGASRSGKPTLFMGGQEIGEVQKKLGVGGSTGTALLIAGGVGLVALVVLLAAKSDLEDDSCDRSGNCSFF